MHEPVPARQPESRWPVILTILLALGLTRVGSTRSPSYCAELGALPSGDGGPGINGCGVADGGQAALAQGRAVGGADLLPRYGNSHPGRTS
jgi:hypothetical protein